MKKIKLTRSQKRETAVAVCFTRAEDGGSFAVVKFSVEQFAIIKDAAKAKGLPLDKFFKNAMASLIEKTLRTVNAAQCPAVKIPSDPFLEEKMGSGHWTSEKCRAMAATFVRWANQLSTQAAGGDSKSN